MTAKSRRFVLLIAQERGITAAEIHRRLGRDYAHGHHKYTYDTVKRLRQNKFIEPIAPRPGLRGIGYRIADRVIEELRK